MTTMVSFDNDWTVFFTRPISGTVMALAVLSLVVPMVRAARQMRQQARRAGQPAA
jgi:putative tricarboxylic transport membrane protein